MVVLLTTREVHTGEVCQMGCSYELEADSHDKIFPEVKKRSISSIVCDQWPELPQCVSLLTPTTDASNASNADISDRNAL